MSRLQGEAPLTSWELDKVRGDADRAAKHLYTERRRVAETKGLSAAAQIDMWGRVYWRAGDATV